MFIGDYVFIVRLLINVIRLFLVFDFVSNLEFLKKMF